MKKVLLIATIAVIVISCNRGKNNETGTKEISKNSQPDSVRVIIERAWADHVDADVKGDAIAASSVFDDEGTYIEYGSPQVIGRVALDSTEVTNLKQYKVLNAKHTIEGLSLEGNYAFQLGQVNARFKITADNTEIDIAKRYMASWKKQLNGSWRIHYFIFYP